MAYGNLAKYFLLVWLSLFFFLNTGAFFVIQYNMKIIQQYPLKSHSLLIIIFEVILKTLQMFFPSSSSFWQTSLCWQSEDNYLLVWVSYLQFILLSSFASWVWWSPGCTAGLGIYKGFCPRRVLKVNVILACKYSLMHSFWSLLCLKLYFQQEWRSLGGLCFCPSWWPEPLSLVWWEDVLPWSQWVTPHVLSGSNIT